MSLLFLKSEDNINNYSIEIVRPAIGAGSYGEIYLIYLCKKSNIESSRMEAVMKVIHHSKSEGLLCLLEPYIMKYLSHPYLVHSYKVEISSSYNLQIIQPRAYTDAASLIKKNKYNLSKEILKKWCWNIICAVATLHSKGIMHGDIKSSNLLVFGTGDLISSTIKLADYGLSVFIMDPYKNKKIEKYFTPYTQSHRAPEVWKREFWSYPADIWALGCTFYELNYQRLLFPDQKGHFNVECSNLDCIKYWEQKIYLKNVANFENYSHFNLPDNNCMWNDIDNINFNDLILKMLKIDVNDRFTIWDLATHPYFDSISIDERKYFPPIDKQFFPILGKEYISDPLWPEFFNLTNDSEVATLGISIYRKNTFVQENIQISKEICLRIAHKLIYNKLPYNFSQITFGQLQEEISLCNRLSFNFL